MSMNIKLYLASEVTEGTEVRITTGARSHGVTRRWVDGLRPSIRIEATQGAQATWHRSLACEPGAASIRAARSAAHRLAYHIAAVRSPAITAISALIKSP
jgi:hypothetical protein